jgi:hypothetical protein
MMNAVGKGCQEHPSFEIHDSAFDSRNLAASELPNSRTAEQPNGPWHG